MYLRAAKGGSPERRDGANPLKTKQLSSDPPDVGPLFLENGEKLVRMGWWGPLNGVMTRAVMGNGMPPALGCEPRALT